VYVCAGACVLAHAIVYLFRPPFLGQYFVSTNKDARPHISGVCIVYGVYVNVS
jgi:hypothetical protein